jgi:tetratricopeptide (TPR) repeat protein
MTSWHYKEYILKGVFLGLWVFFALQVPAEARAARIDILWVVGWVCAGLAIAFAAGAALQWSRGLRPWHNWAAFPLVVVLESPTFIYAGIMGGLVVGVLSGTPGAESWASKLAGTFGLSFNDIKHATSQALPDDDPLKGKLPGDWLTYCVLIGIGVGFALYRLRLFDDRRRFWGSMGLVAVMVAIAADYISKVPGLESENARFNFGLYLLFGLPFIYLLSFCGDAEESDVDAMLFCGTLGAGLHLIGIANIFAGLGSITSYLIPLVLYFVYTTRVMPGLNVFKHALRGYSYMSVDRLRLALRFFNRALELDPRSQLASTGLVALHNNLTLSKLDDDPELVNELDFSLCLDRAATLLMPPNPPPSAQARAEAERFLALVEQKKPAYLARADYLRVISRMHAKEYDAAADTLSRLLNPETPGYHPKVRNHVLFDAWDLALRLHPRLVERLGFAELNKPGRRIEAIGAVERKLVAEPTHPAAKEYKTLLYSQLQEGEFIAAMGASGAPPRDFAYEYVEQLGLALVDDADPERRERGMGYLRMAGRGLPERGPGIYTKLAQVYDKHGDGANASNSLEMAKQVGLAVGPRNLARDQWNAYLDALRKLADLADQRGDYETAINELRQYQEDRGPAALETYRKLAELHGKLAQTTGENKEVLNALLMTANGLAYSRTDADLLKKRDSFYYSLEPDQLRKTKDVVKKWFDVQYCVDKAMSVLNSKEDDLELLDWASHLATLAGIMQPDSNGVRLVEARVLLRRGERDAGLKILEDIFYDKPKGSGDEEDAWYTSAKLLGRLYLDELGKPENALNCFQKFKDYHKSGADTLYQIARCYEAMGNLPHAIQFYRAVTGYEGHPLYWDAKESLKRLGKE